MAPCIWTSAWQFHWWVFKVILSASCHVGRFILTESINFQTGKSSNWFICGCYQHTVLLWISVTDLSVVFFSYILLEMSPGTHICDRAGVFGQASLHTLLPACSYVMLASRGQWCVGFYGDIAYIDGLQHGPEALIRQPVWPQLLPNAILWNIEEKTLLWLYRIGISSWR